MILLLRLMNVLADFSKEKKKNMKVWFMDWEGEVNKPFMN